MRIIPAIDIIEGKCVRLTKGDYSTKKIYNENPLEVAKEFQDSGIEYLHLVDLEGAKSKKIINYRVLENIATNTKLKIDFGGGLKSDRDIQIAFESGASQVTAGSIAVSSREIFDKWLKQYGAGKIILGADCENRKIKTNGWLEESKLDVLDFIKTNNEVEYVICTDISRDGLLKGPSVQLYEEILMKTKVKLIASGGISCIEDVSKMKEIGCEGTIIGKAIYEGKVSLKELSDLC